jgi:hypothetical protein
VVDAEGDRPEHLEDVGHAAAVALRQLGAKACHLQPVLTGESFFEVFCALQLVLQVTVDIVRVLRQHTREDAVKQREHLPVDGRHALGRGLIAVLHFRFVYGNHRLQKQIADEFAEGHPLGVRHFLELIADMIVDPYIQNSHAVLRFYCMTLTVASSYILYHESGTDRRAEGSGRAPLPWGRGPHMARKRRSSRLSLELTPREDA